MHRGYVKIWRKIYDNEIWKKFKSPYTEREAWLDMILQANHKPKLIEFKGQAIMVERGEVLKTLQTWAERWRWSKSKVNRFFDFLKVSGMVTDSEVKQESEQEVKQKPKHLKLCGYGDYQDPRNKTETKSETVIGTYNNNNNKNIKKIKKINNKKEKINKKKFKFGSFQHVLLTEEENQKLKERFGELGAFNRIKKLDEGIELKGYKYKSHYLAILKWEERSPEKRPYDPIRDNPFRREKLKGVQNDRR